MPHHSVSSGNLKYKIHSLRSSEYSLAGWPSHQLEARPRLGVRAWGWLAATPRLQPTWAVSHGSREAGWRLGGGPSGALGSHWALRSPTWSLLLGLAFGLRLHHPPDKAGVKEGTGEGRVKEKSTASHCLLTLHLLLAACRNCSFRDKI